MAFLVAQQLAEHQSLAVVVWQQAMVLDLYERGTRWVDRYQKTGRQQKLRRAEERGQRTHAHKQRCCETYAKEKRKKAEKVARRTATFRVQRQRYEGCIRRGEPMSNPVVSRHLDFDLGSSLHCPRIRKSPRQDMLTQGKNLYSSMLLSASN